MTADGGARRVIDDRFELLERLGGGGMGLVWRARDTELHREVALKEVRPPDPRYSESPAREVAVLRERVLREARALARLQHPNVVTIHHIVTSQESEYPWLVMELVRGGSLADRLERGTLSPVEAARLGRGLLAGLTAAHSAGIMHRDVKPGNVLLREDGSPVLTDFGIAALSELTALTTTGSLVGSPEYIAPERLRGREGEPASDLWSLGMLLYVALEGVSPLRRSTVLATLAAVLDESIPPARRAGVLAPVLTALLSREVEDRPGAAALDRFFAEVETGTARNVETGTARDAPRTGQADEGGADDGQGEEAGPPESPELRRRWVERLATALTQTSAAQVREESDSPDRGRITTSDDVRAEAEPEDAVPEQASRSVKPPAPRDTPSQATPTKGPAASTRTRPTRFRRLVTLLASLALIGLAVDYVPDLLTESAGGETSDSSPVTPTDKTSPTAPSPEDTASAEPGAEAQQDEDYLMTPKGVREAVAALRPLIGGTVVSSMSSHGSHMSLRAPRKDKPELTHGYSYRDGKAEDDGPSGLTPEAPGLDMAKFDWDKLPGLWREAETGLGIEDAERSHFILGEEKGKLVIRLYIQDDYGGASMIAASDGTVVRRFPR